MTRPPFRPGSFARPGEFVWMLGIEDTCVPPTLDEHELTGHTLAWKSDLRLAAELGASGLRYGVSWPLVHKGPGQFDWSGLDDQLEYATGECGLTVVADLVHYGTPTWLPDSFADPRYPDAIEEFAAALAERYPRLTHFTPLNEPVTTASFCGLRGIWPPRLSGWDGWTAVIVPAVVGMARAIRAIRAVRTDAQIVHVEAATDVVTSQPHLDAEVELYRDLGWLPTDMLLGHEHPRYDWLIEHGADPKQLEYLAAEPAIPDLIGVNYYPDLTPRRLHELDGQVTPVTYNRDAAGLRDAVRAFADRYGLPLLITETSIEGDDEVRRSWLRSSIEEVAALRAEGVDLRGYTWWPLFDFVDWSYAAGGANVEEFAVGEGSEIGFAPPLGDPADGKTAFLRRMGLVRLEERADGVLDRVPTEAANDFRRLVEGGSG